MVERAGARRLVRVVEIDVSKTPLPTRLFPRRRTHRALPDPDLILCAGRRTHRPALAFRRARGGRLVVCMRPSVSMKRFDMCLIPRHDNPPTAENVVVTTGAIVAVRPSDDHESDRGVILIGGPSKHYGCDRESLVADIRGVVEASRGVRWELTTSRRTPAEVTRALVGLAGDRLTVTPAAETPRGWVSERLSRAGSAWITEDSVSMICEAVTSGAAVGVLAMPRRGESRVARGVDDLVRRGVVTAYADVVGGRALTAPAGGLDEADRAAGLILERFFGLCSGAPGP